MGVLKNVINTINKSNLDWNDIAVDIGIYEEDIRNIESQSNPVKEFVHSLTKTFWEEIFRYVDIKTFNEDSCISSICKLGDIISKQQAKELKKIEDVIDASAVLGNHKHVQSAKINVVEEICSRISQWEKFGRIMNLEETFINKLRRNFETCEERNREIMNQYLNRNSLQQMKNVWKFWRHHLEQFNDGMLVINEVETLYPSIIPHDLKHIVTSETLTYIGHPFQYHESVEINKEDSLLQVEIGSENFPISHFQEYSTWLETQQRYIDIYSSMKDRKSINFSDLYKSCPVLNTLKQFMLNSNDDGFVYKGVHYVDHISLFKDGAFPKEYFNDTYFCFLKNDNVVLFVTKCTESLSHALLHSRRNIQIANSLHEELQSKAIIQVNVLLHRDNEKFCEKCADGYLCINEKVFSHTKCFTSWYQKLFEKTIKKLKSACQHQLTENNDKVCLSMKKDLITFEALENNDFPTFSPISEDQIHELKKLVLLSPTQFLVLHTPKYHILLRGSYGSGKSLVLIKKFKELLAIMDEDDIIYLICNDQQSKLVFYMKSIKSKFENKYIIVCSSKDMISHKTPTLSLLLEHIRSIWKDRKVHIFLDEVNGSCFDKGEVKKLKEILKTCFQESYIVVALQSMEEYVINRIRTKRTDIGYQYELLQEETSFTLYNLDYTLRCSVEINQFVKATSDIIESAHAKVSRATSFHDLHTVVDKELGREKTEDIDEEFIETKLSYNQSNDFGHSVSTGDVNVYFFDKEKSDKPKNLPSVYITIIEFILTNASEFDCKYVICTYDEDLFNHIYFYLWKNSSFRWTDKLHEFIKQESEFTLLLTDYASVRGYEFPNFIFLLPFGTKFLKYRIIECIARATTNLYVVADNVKVTDDLVDKRCIETWKSLNCVTFVDCLYTKFTDTLKFLHQGIELFSKRNVSTIIVGKIKRYPWMAKTMKHGVEGTKVSEEHSIRRAIKYLVANDDIVLLEEFLKIQNINILSYTDDHSNLLHIASEQGALNIVNYLIDHFQFDVNAVNDEYHWTSMHYAAREGHVAVINTLMCHGASPDTKTSDFMKYTPLLCAAQSGHARVVEFLLSHNANTNLQEFYGSMPPLHYAASYGHLDIMELLINNQADIHVKDNSGETALHSVAQAGQLEALKILVEHQADINAKSNDNTTPLHLAAYSGTVDVIEELLNLGADINAQNNYCKTPLHYAADYGRFNAVKILLKHNADTQLLDIDGRKPIDLARSFGYGEITRLLSTFS